VVIEFLKKLLGSGGMGRSTTSGKKLISLALIPTLLSGCATYHLTDHTPQYLLNKHAEATKGVCAVAPFSYEPIEKGDDEMMDKADLDKWNTMFFEAVNRADICGRAVRVSSLNLIPANATFVIDGKVTEFSFERNWVPMFFPVWTGLTVLSLGIYGLAAGPMTTTQVDFSFSVNLKNAKTLQIIETNAEKFESTDVQTLYSDSYGNPYNNPGHAFEPTLNSAVKHLSDGIMRSAPQKAPLSSKEAAIRQLGELRENGKLSEEEYIKAINKIVN